MSSTSTTWTTDTNTKSGVVQVYSSNVSVLRVVADEGGSAILDLFADQGDDNADKWRMWVNASDDDLHFSNYTSGTAWTDILTLQDGGNVGIGTSSPGELVEIAKSAGDTVLELSTWSTSDAHQPRIVFQKSSTKVTTRISYFECSCGIIPFNFQDSIWVRNPNTYIATIL